MLRNSTTVYLFAVLCTLMVTPAQARQRSFVASYGDDTNICDTFFPCRTFAKAVTVTDPNGEVVALDSAEYGAVTLTQSISLTVAPGFYAGISVFPSGTSAKTAGVTIATAGVNIVLRGLTIIDQSGDYGILITADATGAKLSIENCVISNFFIDIQDRQYGILVETAAAVRMVNTIVRDNDIGIGLSAGATANISGSKFLSNSGASIFAHNATANTTTSAAVSDTVVMGVVTPNNLGIFARADVALATAKIEIIRTVISNTETGVQSQSQVGTASVSIRKSMVTGSSQCGLAQVFGGATLVSYGNNTLSDNGTNYCGPSTLTTAAPL